MYSLHYCRRHKFTLKALLCNSEHINTADNDMYPKQKICRMHSCVSTAKWLGESTATLCYPYSAYRAVYKLVLWQQFTYSWRYT
jgi:hypothetical protein